jgi:hypothetical protein
MTIDMPPIFASSLDALAQQQNYYDGLFSSAARDNANAATQAQQAQVNLALGQRAAQTQQDQLNQEENFQAQQNSLQRQAEADRANLQYSTKATDAQRRLNAKSFEDVAKDAMAGALPADPNKIKTLYPNFTADQINQLFQYAGSASLNRLKQTASQSANSGQPPTPDMVDAAGVPAGTDFEKQAHAMIASLRAPYEQDYTKSTNLAQAGNTASTVQGLRTPVAGAPQPSALNYLNPVYDAMKLGWRLGGPMVSADDIAQPTDAAVSRTSSLASLAAQAAAVKSNPAISGQPGAYTSNTPQSWAPQPSSAPAMPAPLPLVPASPQSAPLGAPPMAPPGAAPALNTKPKPTRAQAAQFVARYGQAGAIQALKQMGFDTSGYAD